MLLVATAAALACTSARAVTFNTFVTGPSIAAVLGGNSTIGFAYAGAKFVGSVYFNQQLYSTDQTGGGVAKFGAPVAAFGGGETYVSSSLGAGGFGPRDVYAGNESLASVFRFANDGSSQSLFTSGLNGGARSIAFDPYGLYGKNMIVATRSGNIYKVDILGVATLLASLGSDTEGISFAPQPFGPYAAETLFVASEGMGRLSAVSPAGEITTVVNGMSLPEMVSFVPCIGHAIITGEGGHQVYDVSSDGFQFNLANIAFFPGQAEDGIFVTVDIIGLHPSPSPGR